MLPPAATKLLLQILWHFAEGRAVRLLSADGEMSTGEAAVHLGVSRPFVVKQMDSGRLPYRKVGTHRRVRVIDLVEYQGRDGHDPQRRCVSQYGRAAGGNEL